jgi:hypothetical protein
LWQWGGDSEEGRAVEDQQYYYYAGSGNGYYASNDDTNFYADDDFYDIPKKNTDDYADSDANDDSSVTMSIIGLGVGLGIVIGVFVLCISAKCGLGKRGMNAKSKAEYKVSIINNIPVLTRADKAGEGTQENTVNPLGDSVVNESNDWALQHSADRLFDSFQALGPEDGFLPPNIAKEVLLKTGLGKDQLFQIWNLSDIDRDGCLDHHEYVVAMFLCDAVLHKNKSIPLELPHSVIPPSKRNL